ncbi:MAG: hypothetical protein K6F51_13795 [Acetatifactor sp.]|nr:hypothetical protein [Acetatifactor sp.]
MFEEEATVEVLLKRVSSIRDDLDFMLYLGIPLLFICMLVPILCIMNGLDKPPAILFLVIFAIIPCSFVIGRVVRVFQYLQMKWMSKNVPARVWEYLPTNTVCGRPPTWRLKVLTYAEDGYRFLTFSMASQEQPFEKDDIIELQIYKDYILCERK